MRTFSCLWIQGSRYFSATIQLKQNTRYIIMLRLTKEYQLRRVHKGSKRPKQQTDSVWVWARSSVQSLCLCRLVFLWDCKQLEWRVALTLLLVFEYLSSLLGLLFQPWCEGLCPVLMYLITPCLMDIPGRPALSSLRPHHLSLPPSLPKMERSWSGEKGGLVGGTGSSGKRRNWGQDAMYKRRIKAFK